MSTEKVDPATDEEVAEFRCYLNILGASIGGAVVHKLLDLSAKLLARLEAVECERARIERDLEACKEELAYWKW